MTIFVMLCILTFLMSTTAAKEIEILTEFPIIHPVTEQPEDSDNLTSVHPLVEPSTVQTRTSRMNFAAEHRQGLAPVEEENEVGVPPEVAIQLGRSDHLLDQFLAKAIKEFSQKMKNESMDPLRLDDQDLSPIVGHEVFTVKLDNVTLCRLSEYKIQNIESRLRDMRVKVTIHFPVVHAVSGFSAKGTIFDVFQVSGAGNASLVFNDIYARTTLYLTQVNETLQIDSADQPYVDFRSATINLRNNEKQSRKLQQYGVANQLAPILFWLFAGDVVEKTDKTLLNYFNEALKSFQVPAILKKLSVPVRVLRVHVPHRPLPYAYVSPAYFYPVQNFK